MADMNNVCLHWEINTQAKLGEGVSRPRAKDKTRPYGLIVKHPAQRPMKLTLHAPSKRAALRYASNRWPGADVEVAA